jgi:hypothetical protein
MACTNAANHAGIRISHLESCGSARPCHERWLSRNSARAGRSNALTNSRLLQQWSAVPERRLAAHAAARGARIMREVERRGIPWLVVGTWPGPRALERAAKRQKSSWRWCVVCREDRGMDASVIPDLGRLLERELERAVELELAAELEDEVAAEVEAEVELERRLEDEHWPAA